MIHDDDDDDDDDDDGIGMNERGLSFCSPPSSCNERHEV